MKSSVRLEAPNKTTEAHTVSNAQPQAQTRDARDRATKKKGKEKEKKKGEKKIK
jgi:hypothetical protein